MNRCTRGAWQCVNTHTRLSRATAAALISPSLQHAQLPPPSFTTPLFPPLSPSDSLHNLPLPPSLPLIPVSPSECCTSAQLSALSLTLNNAPLGIPVFSSLQFSFHNCSFPPSLFSHSVFLSILCLSLPPLLLSHFFPLYLSSSGQENDYAKQD